ncbi:MAG: carboxypeptidase regulatory-like domain-containing protein, partial [Armatimonadetes bacterium]|nr:carboxypeptidase regulatory-like domain-containing protein [Armatimonadota bacterium]
GFGDFWFENLPDGSYTLTVEAKGFKKKTYDAINTEIDSVNLRDIALDV